jgi:hypothetical protein
MTTPRHLELFIRDGKTAAQCRTETNGRLDDPVSIAVAGPEWSAFVADFGQTQAAEIAALTTGRDEAVSALETQRATMQAEIDRLTALISPPIGPRQIYPRELLGRLTFAEVVAAIRTDNDAAIYAVANLQTTVSLVDLDSEETRTLIGALIVAGILTPERLAEVLA